MGFHVAVVGATGNVGREIFAILAERGYRVLSAGDGEDALAVWRDAGTAIDLLVTDVVMPRLGGRELYGRLSTAQPGLRVLYISGYTDDTIVRLGVREEGVAFLQKPFTAESLARSVRQALAVVRA